MSYYPPPQGQAPPAGFYPPPSGPPQYGGYPPPQQDMYPPPQQGGYPPPQQQGMYPPPQQGGYPPPQQGMYAPAMPYGPGQPITYQPGAMPPQQPYEMQGYNPAPPGQGEWMPMLQQPPNCPPGLAYLTTVSSLYIKQKVELLEAITGFETKNKFTIKNDAGQKVYHAVEKSSCITRCCCGPWRPFEMKILDYAQMEVIRLNRVLACSSCFFPCCLQKMEVFSPPGSFVGSVEQEWSIMAPKFSIKDAVGETVLKIEGPFCTYSICGNVEFKVLSRNGEIEVGRISKQWSGALREIFTDADFFGVSFPGDLDVRIKAVMIGAVFLIDAMFFEKKGNKEEDCLGMI